MSDKVFDLGPAVRHVCANCEFHALETMQGQIMKQMVCHRFPPTMSMISTPQGVQGMTMFPVVQPSMWCYEWSARESLQETAPERPPSSFADHIRRPPPKEAPDSDTPDTSHDS